MFGEEFHGGRFLGLFGSIDLEDVDLGIVFAFVKGTMTAKSTMIMMIRLFEEVTCTILFLFFLRIGERMSNVRE
jgi:hypothetical protein